MTANVAASADTRASMASPLDSLPLSWQRLLALSGVAFAVLLIFGWFLSGGDSLDYLASDEAWVAWADANRLKSGVGGFLMLLAGFALLHFAGTNRPDLGAPVNPTLRLFNVPSVQGLTSSRLLASLRHTHTA